MIDGDLQASIARLQLYVMLLDNLHEALKPGPSYDRVKAIRNDIVHWAPWTITLPVWARIYSALPEAAVLGELLDTIVATQKALRDTVKNPAKKPSIPDPALLGDLSKDVDRIVSAA